MISADNIKSHSNEWLFFIFSGYTRVTATLLALCFLGLVSGCISEPDITKLSGATMGTQWHVTAVIPADLTHDDAALTGQIQTLLDAVNGSMSTYRDDSELSLFNQAPTQQWFPISENLYQVLSAALAVGWQTGGAYDITVGPLVNLWGFGPNGARPEPPTEAQITAVLRRVGQDKLQVNGDELQIRKLAPLYLDLSSIAKGFAVDEVARWLTSQGVEQFLVEVGGEMRVSGHSVRGDAWRVAIESPDSATVVMAQAIRLENVSVATSGDYRNYFEREGRRYSHSIDPRSGQPVEHELVSVTVVHPSAMVADAWATALIILGPEDALALARQQLLAVYFIERRDGGFHSSYTAQFEQYLELPNTE